jgi:hypothetical protein
VEDEAEKGCMLESISSERLLLLSTILAIETTVTYQVHGVALQRRTLVLITHRLKVTKSNQSQDIIEVVVS